MSDSLSRRMLLKRLCFGVGAIALAHLTSRIPTVTAYSYYAVGSQSNTPTIDGVWSDGEWDDAGQLTLSNVSKQVNNKIGNAYFRAKHSSDSFNFIIDVPFDDGTQVQKPAQSQTGINLIIDGNDNGLDSNDLNDPFFGANFLGPGGTFEWGFIGDSYLKQAASQIKMAQGIGTSPNSNNNHRVYEGSLPLEPMIRNSPKTNDDLLPLIGCDVVANDTYGNAVTLVSSPNTMSFKIAPYPVPENLELITPLALATLLLTVYSSRRNRVHKMNPV